MKCAELPNHHTSGDDILLIDPQITLRFIDKNQLAMRRPFSTGRDLPCV
jgi:hypothetical protein